jgi:NADPH:quinone reductase-like Zn-dependent oxidoreductase
MSAVKAVIVKAWGGPENLQLTDLPDPQPGPGEALVKVRYCALNRLDLWVRHGIPAYKIPLPHVLGSDVSGEVTAVGPGCKAAQVGQRVAVAPGRSCRRCDRCLSGRDNLCERFGVIGENAGPGGYAELLAVPEEYLLPIPDAMSFETAAAFPLTFLTAWHMLMTLGGCGPDQWVLVQGAGSGVGTAAIQIAKLAGARVIACSTSEEKLEKAKALGADAGILSTKEDTRQRVRAITGRRMADIAFEHVGPATFDASLKSLRPGGALVTCGATTGQEVPLSLPHLFVKQWRIMGSTMGTLAEMRTVARLAAEGKLSPVLDRAFPLADARAAHEHLAAGRQFGKVLLKVA